MISKICKRLFVVPPVALAAMLGSPAPARACGGLFCSSPQQPINQAAEQIIFAANDDGTVTAVIQIMYQGSAQNFSWLLPVPTVPQGDQLGVGSNLAFQRLQAATNPTYSLNTTIEGTCSDQARTGPAVTGGGAFGAGTGTNGGGNAGSTGGGVTVVASGTIAAFEYKVLSLDASLTDPAQVAIQWLTDNGYNVGSGAPGLIRPYLQDGLYLLALRLTKDADVGSIRPIMITYGSKSPMIPIKLTAVAANDDMGVMTWLLSNGRGVPQNYRSLVLNEARINWFSPSSNYNSVVTAAADEAGGQGFVTEFAGPTTNFANLIWASYEESLWQQFQSGVFSSFQQMFDTSYSNWGTYDGFWDAVRAAVTLPANVAFADFQHCPSCYASDVQFSPSAYIQALQTNVVDPIKNVQKLIDAHPKLTRLYTTMSAAEMTVDPLFTFNADLPDVSNIHTATRVIECNPAVSTFDAPWRIELPQGGIIRGVGSPGAWPDAFATMPSNIQIVQAAASGPGAVLLDNSAEISAALQTYNAGAGATTSGSTSATGSTASGASTGSGTAGASANSGGGSGCSMGEGAGRSAEYGFVAFAAVALARSRRRRSTARGA